MAIRRMLVLVGCMLVVLALASCDLFQKPDVDTDLSEATNIVISDILPGVIPTGATYLCARMDEPLPAGSVVEEDAPNQPGVLAVKPKGLTIGEQSFLFFLDLAPGRYYEHPTKFILVGKSGGHQVIDAVWWPRVNGIAVAEFRDLTPDNERIIAGNAVSRPITRRLMEFAAFDLGVLTRVQREGFLIVQGLMEGQDLFDDATDTYLNGVAFFNAYKKTFSELNGLVEGDAAGVLSAIDALAAKGLSPITIYIIAHGGVDGVRLGGAWIAAQQFHDTFAAHPDTLFNFLLGSCHSGSFIDNLNSLSNVRVVQAACAANGTASPDWDEYDDLVDYNPEDSGSEWTSSILAAAASIVESHWADVAAEAAAFKAPVTSVLLNDAWYGAFGAAPDLGLTNDLDFSHRLGATSPQRYSGEAWGRI